MYIAIINIHGLVRSEHIEMGRDADTGGQTRYAVDLVKELAKHQDVEVDLFTRLIKDARHDADYAKSIEPIGERGRIVRLSCGGNAYVRKELLWPHLDEYVDNLISFFRTQKKIPDILHAHYADAAYVANELAAYFDIPLVFTGHSLGRNKLEYLKEQNTSEEKLNQYYHIQTRIQNEEKILEKADLVITSTEYEKESLYAPYEKRNLSVMQVIPPGLDLASFFPYYHYEIQDPSITEEMKHAQYSMIKELERFLTTMDKPFILALCRPDGRKNIDQLIEIYGKSQRLQALANLVIVAGIRDDISTMEEGEKQVLTDMLLLMDRYDLYGKMAIPKHHNPDSDVPEIYRLAAMKRGLFVSTAALENFGLTFIEASAVGLPFVGTNKGGVQDIQKNCESGILVDIGDHKHVEQTIHDLLTDANLWDTLSHNGVERTRTVYNWEAHAERYLHALKSIKTDKTPLPTLEKRLGSIKHLVVCDIDNTLTTDQASAQRLIAALKEHHQHLGFAVATGRNIDSALSILKQYGYPNPDILITSVGSEIHYGRQAMPDKGWAHYIKRAWKPKAIMDALQEFKELELQTEEGAQRTYKVSYTVKAGVDTALLVKNIKEALHKGSGKQHIILSHDTYLDILPYRAGKGNAILYLAWKWGIAEQDIVTAGDSENDRDMFTKGLSSIIVANHEKSLAKLRRTKHRFFASKAEAAGVLEGLSHFGVIE
ncbi:MAG: HAD-IIB family hydrolase [Sphaerochaeta sp.]|uniref:sucrose-phosphate synthase n=1 Tax=bioreactor metagenome TaxID=1076179 RepID=A0A644XLW2_9ZZZZ|nr:HAD-IIB family hydrolase [Sphaerochaeta sp.]MDD4038461.1 HAD-IIB family hydrolase [Sphaerochaeta sp.]